MKILYAVQATGNGHISRAVELLPYLEQYGQVDVFLSGENCHLPTSLPVKYKSRGVSLFYGNRGGLNYFKMWQKFSIKRIWKEAKALPVEDYDIVINEIMYKHQLLPPAGTNLFPREDPEEWVELFNRGSNAVDLTDWELDGGIGFHFAAGTMLAPGGYLVIAEDAAEAPVAAARVEVVRVAA